MSKVDLIIQSGSTILYPIVEEGISLSWDRKGSPGKLKFSVVKDSVLSFQEGDAVKLSVDGTDKHAYKGKKAYKVHLALKTGEQVLLLRADGGQKFIILDRVEASK